MALQCATCVAIDGVTHCCRVPILLLVVQDRQLDQQTESSGMAHTSCVQEADEQDEATLALALVVAKATEMPLRLVRQSPLLLFLSPSSLSRIILGSIRSRAPLLFASASHGLAAIPAQANRNENKRRTPRRVIYCTGEYIRNQSRREQEKSNSSSTSFRPFPRPHRIRPLPLRSHLGIAGIPRPDRSCSTRLR